jgi:hypothetical protein
VRTVADLGYIATGYAGTGAALLWYRWRLARRAQRAGNLIDALSGRRVRARRPPR